MYSKNEIEAIVFDAIKTVTGIQTVYMDTCLIDRHINIFPADFLYIFDFIERKIGRSISRILVENTETVFIVSNLVDAICRMCELKEV